MTNLSPEVLNLELSSQRQIEDFFHMAFPDITVREGRDDETVILDIDRGDEIRLQEVLGALELKGYMANDTEYQAYPMDRGYYCVQRSEPEQEEKFILVLIWAKEKAGAHLPRSA